MRERSPPQDVARWKALLNVPTTDTPELYDPDQGVKQYILRAFGFHDEYLSYTSSNDTRSRERLKSAGHNWSSVSRAWRSVRRTASIQLLHWTYSSFFNQHRLLPHNDLLLQTDAFATHARGVFINKARALFIVYEPRVYEDQVCQWFGSSLNNFAKHYKSFKHILIYGNQETTPDCEKRVILFGICCWPWFLASRSALPRRKCHCGLHITHITALYIRK